MRNGDRLRTAPTLWRFRVANPELEAADLVTAAERPGLFTSFALRGGEEAPFLLSSSPLVSRGERTLRTLCAHCATESTPSPSQEGNGTAWPVPLLGAVMGGCV